MGFAAGMIMSMARAAVQFAESEQTGVTLHPERCLHRLNKVSSCSNCVDVCPVAALALESQDDGRTAVVLTPPTCVACGLCTPVCPVGALESDQGSTELLAYVSQREKRGIVELACALHPAPVKGPPQSNLIIRTRSCLGSLGASTLTSLYALGVRHVLLRVDACEACPLGQRAKPQIALSATQVEALFAADSALAAPVTLLETVRDEWPLRTVIAARSPAKSRRDFFRSLTTAQEVPAGARELSLVEQSQDTKQPPTERRRLLKALAFLPEELYSAEPLVVFPTTTLTVDANCNACGVCARACPTGAIEFDVDDKSNYRLSFRTGACTDCGVCLDLCEQNALQRGRTPALKDWMAVEPHILQTGILRRCEKCGAAFAGRPESTLCALCDFRRENPFGSRTPRWFKGQADAPQTDDIRH